MEGQAVLGDSNVAAGKFFFGVNRGPTPLPSDFGSTSPPISGLAGHGNNASKVGHSPTIDFFGRLPSCSHYDISLKHCSQLHYSPERFMGERTSCNLSAGTCSYNEPPRSCLQGRNLGPSQRCQIPTSAGGSFSISPPMNYAKRTIPN